MENITKTYQKHIKTIKKHIENIVQYIILQTTQMCENIYIKYIKNI